MPTTPEQRARARQWSKLAGAIGLLFASLPVVSRVFFGSWDFIVAAEVACLLFILAGYFYVLSTRIPVLKDAALMFDQASELAASGHPDRAVTLLTKTIRQNPRVWQAFQYRGQLYLQLGDPARALQDFTQAVSLAPDEPVLRALRDQASDLLVS